MEKINIAELLKNCPSGMELDCTIMENVYFDEVLTNTIKCHYIKNSTKTRSTVYFTIFGEYFSIDNAKCVIFPKGKTTWEGFVPPCQFKDGDVLYIDCNDNGDTNKQFQYIFILKEINEGNIYSYCYIDEADINKSFEICWLSTPPYIPRLRLATEEEKQKLFNTIKANGYKWNAETKTLEKLELAPNKFDINTLKPFESKVLVRTYNKKWVAAFYSHYDKDSLNYCVVGGLWYEQCIPYEGNEHLLNTTDNCNEFYKNW